MALQVLWQAGAKGEGGEMSEDNLPVGYIAISDEAGAWIQRQPDGSWKYLADVELADDGDCRLQNELLESLNAGIQSCSSAELTVLREEVARLKGEAKCKDEAIREVIDDVLVSTERWGDSSVGPATVPLEPGPLPIAPETFALLRAALAPEAKAKEADDGK